MWVGVMKNRRCAREAALQALYQCDVLNEWSIECATACYDAFQPLEDGDDLNYKFSRSLILGAVSTKDFLDNQIQSASTHWSISRMPIVDRNILRLATFEIFFMPDIPASVSINEAIEIAKRFSNADAHLFINGVLDKVANIFNENKIDVEELKVRSVG